MFFQTVFEFFSGLCHMDMDVIIFPAGLVCCSEEFVFADAVNCMRCEGQADFAVGFNGLPVVFKLAVDVAVLQFDLCIGAG